ncbi:hypothetical protein ACHWQZ_G019445 [Mnemiopsis leidyi]
MITCGGGVANELKIYMDMTADDVPMEYNATAALYTKLKEMERKYVKSVGIMQGGKKSGVCRDWIELDNITPEDQNIFDYLKVNNHLSDSTNKKKSAYKVIKKHLKKVTTEKKLAKKLKKLKNPKVKKALEEISDFGKDYLKSSWVNEIEHKCGQDLAGIKALVAVESRMIDIADEDCSDGILNRGTSISLERALQDIASVLGNQEFLEQILVNATDASATVAEFNDMRKINNDSSLAVLSLPNVRKIILHQIELKSCESCDCKTNRRLKAFKNAIDRIKEAIPSIGQCKDIWNQIETQFMNIKSNDVISAEYFVQNKKTIMANTSNIAGIDDVLDFINTEIPMFIRKSYINLPYNEAPIKHGLWWVGLFMLPYENCQQFAEAQLLRKLAEEFSMLFYFNRNVILDRCGVIPAVDAMDSYVMANKALSFVSYNMVIAYPTGLQNITSSQQVESEITANAQEIQILLSFAAIKSRTLDLDPKTHGSNLESMFQMNLQMDSFSELKTVQSSYVTFQNCPTCEFYRKYVSTADFITMLYLNYYEGRKYPFSYEKDLYSQMRGELVNDSQKLQNLGCLDEAEDQLEALLNSTITIMDSNAMKSQEAFDRYMWYIKPKGQSVTRKQFLDSLAITNTLNDFQNSIFMRIFKSGIEEKDDRSIFDDFREFEEDYAGKKSTKLFKNQWKEYLHNRDCMIGYEGLFRQTEEPKTAKGDC